MKFNSKPIYRKSHGPLHYIFKRKIECFIDYFVNSFNPDLLPIPIQIQESHEVLFAFLSFPKTKKGMESSTRLDNYFRMIEGIFTNDDEILFVDNIPKNQFKALSFVYQNGYMAFVLLQNIRGVLELNRGQMTIYSSEERPSYKIEI